MKKYIITRGWAEALADLPPEVGIWPLRPGLVAVSPVIIDPDPLTLDSIGRELFRAGKLPLVAVGAYERGVPVQCWIPLAKDWLSFSLAAFAPYLEPLDTYCEDIARHCLARGKFGGNRKMVEAVAKAYGAHVGLVLHKIMTFVREHREVTDVTK